MCLEVTAEVLGAAFEVAQVTITRVTTQVEWLHRAAELKGFNLTLPSAANAIRAFDARSQIETIWGAANYAKHGAEWLNDWDAEAKREPSRSGLTIATIRAAGAHPNDSVAKNLERILARIGGRTLRESLLDCAIRPWRQAIGAAVRTDLMRAHQL